jgi:hypothetical protein
MAPFGQFCIDFRAVMKRSETPQNMSFGSNRVDKVRSLQNFEITIDWATHGAADGDVVSRVIFPL